MRCGFQCRAGRLLAAAAVLAAAAAAQSHSHSAPQRFARESCTVTEFGAVGDNRTVNTRAFRAAVLACATVVVPPGWFITGALNLTSHQRFQLEAGAVVAAVWDGLVTNATLLEEYPRTPGVPPFGHHPGNIPSFRTRPSALVSARHATNVSIVGAGGTAYTKAASTINGLGWHWRSATSTFDTTFSLVEFYNCTDVTISGVTVANAATWSVHPFDCEGVHIWNVSVVGPRWLGGVSGIHPDSARNVVIEDCFVDVGDDGIVVASYHDFYGVPKPSANITVRRCTVLSRNIAIGAGTAGGIRDILFEDCVVGDDAGSSPWAFKIKSQTNSPAIIERITVRRLRLGRIQPNAWQQPKPEPAINIGIQYGENITALPVLRDVVIEDVAGTFAAVAGSILGLSQSPIMNLTVRNVTFQHYTRGWSCAHVDSANISHVAPALDCPTWTVRPADLLLSTSVTRPV